jgi:hypothetical protein
MEVVMRKQTLTVAAALLTSLFAGNAIGEEMHNITCVVNATQAVIAYEIKYGSGSYITEHIAEGYETSYAQESKSYQPITITYDSILRPSSEPALRQTHALKSRQASGKSCALGHRYTFKIDPNIPSLIRLYD